MTTAPGPLARWYSEHGRHDLPWRTTRDPWVVLVSEVMLQQTPVARILKTWPGFIDRFPTPDTMARAPLGEVLRLWDRLGYPRRARRLRDAARIIAGSGWPEDLTTLPGVGRYTAAAVGALVDDADVVAIDVNLRRVAERVSGRDLTDRTADPVIRRLGRGLRPRDRLLALMDLGALVCTARNPACAGCPLRRRCTTRGVREEERRRPQAPYAGSLRQRRGLVMAALRAGPAPVATLDREALDSLVADGLAIVRTRRAVPTATLP